MISRNYAEKSSQIVFGYVESSIKTTTTTAAKPMDVLLIGLVC